MTSLTLAAVPDAATLLKFGRLLLVIDLTKASALRFIGNAHEHRRCGQAFNLSDEEVVERWSENVMWQFFSGMAYYTPKLPCDATQIRRFRLVLGEASVEQSR